MARLPDKINPARRSGGSQFYICLKPMPELDGQYTVFGHVTEGMDVLDALSVELADTNDNPTTAIGIKEAYLGSAPPRGFARMKLWPW
jgi:peptidyl-prolyl cis-trans isomerase B (cyclophilin B)